MPTGQGQRGNIRDKIDRDLLHEYLWKHTDERDRLTVRSNDLAERLGITVPSMSVLMKEMMLGGRVRKVGKSFFIVDPSLWRWRNPTPEAPQTLWG